MENKIPKRNFNVRLDDEMISEISKRSKELEITETEYIRRSIKNSFKEHDNCLKNINKILFLTSIGNVYMEEILENLNFDPAKLAKCVEKINQAMEEFSKEYGVKL